MKKILPLLVAFLLTNIAISKAPQKMSYQAVIRNSLGELVINQQVRIQISIIKDSAAGSSVYMEYQTATTNSNGLISVEIGGGIPDYSLFKSIDWTGGIYFIKTEIDPTGGFNFTITSISQMLSVPYSFYSEKSGESVMLKQRIDLLEDIQIAAGTYKMNDFDGNQYDVVRIGTQMWMKENLKTTKLNDGTPITLEQDGTNWAGLVIPGYCWYNNDEANNKDTFGALYNGQAMLKNLCPIGWHVPSESDWGVLGNYLKVNAGGKLKESGMAHWMSPNTGATNEVGFTALPGGYRGFYGQFQNIGTGAYWWTTTFGRVFASMTVRYDSNSISDNMFYMFYGMSVRCVRDN